MQLTYVRMYARTHVRTYVRLYVRTYFRHSRLPHLIRLSLAGTTSGIPRYLKTLAPDVTQDICQTATRFRDAEAGHGRGGGGAPWKQDLRRRGVALRRVRGEGEILSRDPGKEGGEVLSKAPGKEGVPFSPEEKGSGCSKNSPSLHCLRVGPVISHCVRM